MAISRGPKIVTNGLVLALDASDNNSFAAIDLPIKDGLVMWMDAADDSTFSYSSGTTVSQWRDKSGLNYHMGPKVNGPTRSVVLNSRKVLAFTAAQTIGNNTINLSTSANTVFVVSRLTGTTNGRVLTCNLDSSGNNWLLGHHGGTYNDYYAEGWVSDGGSFDTNWRMYMGDWSGTSTDLANLYSNGTAITTNSSAASQGPKYLGVNYYSDQVSTCEVAEIVVFDRVLSATERKQVHTYLGQKWNISNTDRSIVDISGNNNIGSFGGAAGSQTVANMPVYDFYNKGSLKFDGGDYVLTSIPVLPSPHTSPFTLESFCCPSTVSVAYQTVLGTMNSFSQIGFVNNTFAAGRNGGGGGFLRNSLAAVFANTWYHICMTYDGTNASFYLNGSFLSTQTIGTNGINNGVSLLGSYTSSALSETFNGTIGSARIYNRALTATEVLQNYNAQKSKYTDTIVQQGLVLNLDAGNSCSYGGAGTIFYDVSPTALSWTINNATYNSSDPKYFSYNGSNSWLQSSTSAAYDSQTITMECWFYTSVVVQNGFLFEKGAINSQYSMFLNQGDVFYFRTIGGTISNGDLTFTSSTYLTANAWNHVICTYNGSIKIIYVNGVQVASVNASGTLNTGQTNQYIGKYGDAGNNYPFNGRIGESRVYNIALSAAQVLQNYNATKSRFGL
jgi:hypothetical protein